MTGIYFNSEMTYDLMIVKSSLNVNNNEVMQALCPLPKI